MLLAPYGIKSTENRRMLTFIRTLSLVCALFGHSSTFLYLFDYIFNFCSLSTKALFFFAQRENTALASILYLSNMELISSSTVRLSEEEHRSAFKIVQPRKSGNLI